MYRSANLLAKGSFDTYITKPKECSMYTCPDVLHGWFSSLIHDKMQQSERKAVVRNLNTIQQQEIRKEHLVPTGSRSNTGKPGKDMHKKHKSVFYHCLPVIIKF